ncbi:MAG TPA: pirin family protein [Xanthobacteraceae bacterium]|nr:pirin family protein [Xanthobacteraceae bacterium]
MSVDRPADSAPLPLPPAAAPPASVAQVVAARTSDLGGFTVRRALPVAGLRTVQPRMVGPFIFFDHMGPAFFDAGQGLDVRPHPHIGLATLTYLLEGEIMHRDTLGNAIAIRPGEVNLMTAGRGIAHSERTGEASRSAGQKLHGLQCWLALPATHEEMAPAFAHHGAAEFQELTDTGVRQRVVVGRWGGVTSPVATATDTLFVDATLSAGASMALDADHEERAVYLVSGVIEIQGDRFEEAQLLVLRPGDRLRLKAVTDAKLVALGGAVMDGPRHIWWNFVSSRKDRIETAKADWRNGSFPLVPGDETEFIPLPA